MPVPTISHLHPGTPVSIILKQDQPTGRQVQGRIADILTSGNHPRGIKVRLQDGRIGRVQGVVSGDIEGVSGEELRGDLEGQERVRRGRGGRGGSGGGRGGWGGRFQMRYTDVRLDEPVEEPEQELDLMAFVKEGRKRRGKGKGKGRKGEVDGEADGDVDGDGVEGVSAGASKESTTATATTGVTASCPVCGEFEGDEAAVAHHVERHFADG